MTASLRDPFVSSPVRAPRSTDLALDGAFWRNAAHQGATRLPQWLVRWAPIVIGTSIALVGGPARQTLSRQLARVRGRVGPARDLVEIARTFANFASCLTEELARGSKNDVTPEVLVDDAYVAKVLATTQA